MVNGGVTPLAREENSLIIVHVFVLSKQNSRHGLDLLNDLRADSVSYSIVKPVELFPLLKQLRTALISQWPLNQILMDTSKVWDCPSPQDSIRSVSTFFVAEKLYDPSKYQSVYILAPLPKAPLNTGAPVKEPMLASKDFKYFCFQFDTKMLSVHLKEDTSCNNSLPVALRCKTSLFSPYTMITGYLQKLEGAL